MLYKAKRLQTQETEIAFLLQDLRNLKARFLSLLQTW